MLLSDKTTFSKNRPTQKTFFPSNFSDIFLIFSLSFSFAEFLVNLQRYVVRSFRISIFLEYRFLYLILKKEETIQGEKQNRKENVLSKSLNYESHIFPAARNRHKFFSLSSVNFPFNSRTFFHTDIDNFYFSYFFVFLFFFLPHSFLSFFYFPPYYMNNKGG